MEAWCGWLLFGLYEMIGIVGGILFWRALWRHGIEDGDGLGILACLIAWPIAFVQYYSALQCQKDSNCIITKSREGTLIDIKHENDFTIIYFDKFSLATPFYNIRLSDSELVFGEAYTLNEERTIDGTHTTYLTRKH